MRFVVHFNVIMLTLLRKWNRGGASLQRKILLANRFHWKMSFNEATVANTIKIVEFEVNKSFEQTTAAYFLANK